MMGLRILIADDESPARARLRSMVEELGHQVCAEAADGLAAERLLEELKPDAILLDIEMPGIDGITLAKRMETEHPETPVVLVTAHVEHALAAFDADVCDYVVKPVRRERLLRAFDRVHAKTTKTVPQLCITIGRRKQRVQLDELDYLIAEDGYVLARSAKTEGFVDLSLQELEAQFGDAVLLVRRGCLAVRAAVVGMETIPGGEHRLLFRDGLRGIVISRRQFPHLRKMFAESRA